MVDLHLEGFRSLVGAVDERTIQREASRGEKLGADHLQKIVGTSLDKGEELDALAKVSATAPRVA
jgi:hypothetical protein